MLMAHLDGEDTRLVGVFEGVAGPVHHPGEGGFDPGATVDGVRGGCIQLLSADCCCGDLGGEGLVDCYVGFVVEGADAAELGGGG